MRLDIKFNIYLKSNIIYRYKKLFEQSFLPPNQKYSKFDHILTFHLT